MQALDFVRAALPTFFTLLALVYATRMTGACARLGVPLTVSSRPGTVQHVTHSLFRTLRLAVWAVTVIRVPFPQFDAQIGVFPALMQPVTVLAGLALLFIGFGLSSYVHHYMATDWRSGADQNEKTTLLTSGPFARVRNPMFIGVMAAQTGFFLALPSVFSLVCLLSGVVAVIAQARYEERELAKRFGASYLAYLAITPGWVPRR
ncbi:MAG: isoprenylcysteine carboxylmethyltransferase family protein [Rhizobiales bacterium]|nr:isoprenylcysteine carboxylmethyltransferase family protein [Hyphomicrobiales bacterium]